MRPSFAHVSTRLRVVAAVALVAIAAACSSSTEPQAIAIEQQPFADSLKIDLAKFTRQSSGVFYRDSIVGSGALVAAGQVVTITYVGFLPNGSIFDQSNSAHPTFQFTIGDANVIPGFSLGVIGMKVGGRRRMIIPADLAYGAQARTGLPAYSNILFDVTLVSSP